MQLLLLLYWPAGADGENQILTDLVKRIKLQLMDSTQGTDQYNDLMDEIGAHPVSKQVPS